MKHNVFRYSGNYDGLVDDLNDIASKDWEVINVHQVSYISHQDKHNGEWVIFCRKVFHE